MLTGQDLGPYRILEKLGEGAMGEVYRARDARLDRTVAIKVLPPGLASDEAARARFEREARAVAALDHPHICGIFDVGEANGTHFLVMPCLEGQTLAARLEKGALPLDQALTIAIQIAGALDKAHRQGIVHRDLKPANLMLTKTGAKLLDFGLAKLKAPGGPIALSSIERLATTPPRTSQGTILGTVPYMAPEQVEGKEADHRADIWALGAVLYEMLTGTRPFPGETAASVIGAILKDAPPPLSARQPLVPRALDDVVRGCLAKDPDERWQSIGDVGRLLQGVVSNKTQGAERHGRPSGAWRAHALWAAVTALLLIALGFVTLWRRPPAPTGDVVRLSVNPPEGMMFAPHGTATVPTPQFAVSPDGRSIAFVVSAPSVRPTLWVRSLADVDARALPGTDNAQEPFWSLDGRWIGFSDPEGRLKKVDVTSGIVQTIATNVSNPRGASWGADDTILFGAGFDAVYRVPAAGGSLQQVTVLDSAREEGSHRWPQYLPDGRHLLFTVLSGLDEQRGVWVGELGGQTRRRLLTSDANARYVAPGYLLSLNDDTLVSQSFDHERLELTGQPSPVAARVGRGSRGDGAFSASGRTLAYASAMLRPGRLIWFDRTGAPLGEAGPDGEHDIPDFRLSPDGARLAASLVDPTVSVPNIWVTDLVRGGTSRFTVGPALNAAAIWSPDSGRIAFRSNRKGLVEFFARSASLGGVDDPILLEDRARAMGLNASNLVPSDWSPDGQHIAVVGRVPADIWFLPVDRNSQTVQLTQSPSDQMHANFSPDGRFIAYTSNESGRYDVYVETLPPSDRRWPISTNADGGYEPRWRADGREIYYLSGSRKLMVVPVSSGAQPFGVPQPLFQTEVHAGVDSFRTHYVPDREGTRFLVHTRGRDPAPVSINVVLNWTAALKR
jgi:Tol biopolymer transport system component